MTKRIDRIKDGKTIYVAKGSFLAFIHGFKCKEKILTNNYMKAIITFVALG
jgi:hypothetical protein